MTHTAHGLTHGEFIALLENYREHDDADPKEAWELWVAFGNLSRRVFERERGIFFSRMRVR